MRIERRQEPNPNSHLWRDLQGVLHILVDEENGVWLNMVHGSRVVRGREHRTIPADRAERRAFKRAERRGRDG